MLRPEESCRISSIPWMLIIWVHTSPGHQQPWFDSITLQRRHNERDGVSNHQPRDCLLKRLFSHKEKKTSKPRITSLCAGNSPVTDEYPTHRTSNAKNVSIWWRHHEINGSLSSTKNDWNTCTVSISGNEKIVFFLCFPDIIQNVKFNAGTKILMQNLPCHLGPL